MHSPCMSLKLWGCAWQRCPLKKYLGAAGGRATLVEIDLSMRWCSWFMFNFGLDLEQIVILT